MLLKISIIGVSKMRKRGMVFALMIVTSFVFMWKGLVNQTYLQEDEKCVKWTQIPTLNCTSALFELNPGCCPHKVCPEDHFPFFLRSGTADVVGPKICFNNKIVMSGGQNNVGNGVNIVLVDGENGEIVKSSYFNANLYSGLLEFLKTIQDGNIVLVASYEDPAGGLTDEIREHFSRVGSTMIHSVKYRDSWVFAGAAGLNRKSPFEKLIVNDEERNAYGEWPDMEELSGCFPRKIRSALN